MSITKKQDCGLKQEQGSMPAQTHAAKPKQNQNPVLAQARTSALRPNRVIALTLDAPSEKQKLFLKAKTKHIGFGGARGGGKSWAVRTKAVLLSLRSPGIKLPIVRRTYSELMGNHIRILRSQLTGIAK